MGNIPQLGRDEIVAFTSGKPALPICDPAPRKIRAGQHGLSGVGARWIQGAGGQNLTAPLRPNSGSARRL